MPTYAINADLKGNLLPSPHHSLLDELMESLGFSHGGQACRPKIKMKATAFRNGNTPGIVPPVPIP